MLKNKLRQGLGKKKKVEAEGLIETHRTQT